MKKVITIISMVALILTLAACGNTQEVQTTQTTSAPETTTVSTTADERDYETESAIKSELFQNLSPQLIEDLYNGNNSLLVSVKNDEVTVWVTTYRGCTLPAWNYELAQLLDNVLTNYGLSKWTIGLNAGTYTVLTWDKNMGENGIMTNTKDSIIDKEYTDEEFYEYWKSDLKVWSKDTGYNNEFIKD